MNCKCCNNYAIKYSKYSSGNFCSKSCANSFSTKFKRLEINKKLSIFNKGKKLSNEHKQKISLNNARANLGKIVSDETRNKLIKSCKKNNIKEIICKGCGKIFKAFTKNEKRRTCCSQECKLIINKKSGQKGGLISSSIQSKNKRSKNEKLFYELCLNKFLSVINNTPMFNGWDADIILLNEKIAILWNGKWHYEKITKKHSVEQVQNRDKIKILEIRKLGFKEYIIKDLGRFNPEFVKKEFDIFCNNMPM